MTAYHLTPRSLVGRQFDAGHFQPCRIALVGYCPPPAVLQHYAPRAVAGQPFIHVPPASVQVLEHQGMALLSLTQIYGGPVSASTIEELAYYEFDYVLAYGLAGALAGTDGAGPNSTDLAMGDAYLVTDALVADGTTPHYTSARFVASDAALAQRVAAQWRAHQRDKLVPVRAATGDAIYREDDALLETFRHAGCTIVNLDSAHLYAVAQINSAGRVLRAIQCGIVSDVVHRDGAAESTLATMLGNHTGAAVSGPLDRVGDIVRFYVDALVPDLLTKEPSDND